MVVLVAYGLEEVHLVGVKLFRWGGGVADDFFVPAGVIPADEGRGDVTAPHGVEPAALGADAHVNVNHEEADAEQGGSGMHDDCGVAQKTQTPGNVFGKPKNDAAEN